MLQGLRLLDLADVNGLVKSFFRYKEQSNPCTHGHKCFRDATFIELCCCIKIQICSRTVSKTPLKF